MDALVIIMLCILCLLLIYLLVLILVSLFICIGAIFYNIKLYFYPKKEPDKKYNLESIIVRNPNGEIQLGILSV